MNDPTSFDLVVNTDHFADNERVVELILLALRGMGLDHPKAVRTEA